VVAAGATVEGAVLGRGVTVGEGAIVRGLVVAGDGARVAPGSVLEGPMSVATGETAG